MSDSNPCRVPAYITAVNILLRLSGHFFAVVSQENGMSGAAHLAWQTARGVINLFLRNRSTELLPEQRARLLAGVWIAHCQHHGTDLGESRGIQGCSCPAAVTWHEFLGYLNQPAGV